MDIYGQYARWRRSTRFGIPRIGLGNRRLAAMLGDFLYESSSAEDESRRILEWLYEPGKKVLLQAKDRKDLELFTSEHNREERRGAGVKEMHVSWHRMDELSQKIIESLSNPAGQNQPDFAENVAALERLFSTTKALRKFRNQIDHRAPSDNGGRLQFYRHAESDVTVSAIWGWTEVAASYWANLGAIGDGIRLATGIALPALIGEPTALQWPPTGLSIHGLHVLQRSGITVTGQQVRGARDDWARLNRRWARSKR
jgi:hypothetical protein